MVSDGFTTVSLYLTWYWMRTICMHAFTRYSIVHVQKPWYMSKNGITIVLYLKKALFLTKPRLKYSACHWFSLWCQAFGECQTHIPVPFSLTGHSESNECLGIANVVGFCCRAYLRWEITASHESNRHVENKAFYTGHSI